MNDYQLLAIMSSVIRAGSQDTMTPAEAVACAGALFREARIAYASRAYLCMGPTKPTKGGK